MDSPPVGDGGDASLQAAAAGGHEDLVTNKGHQAAPARIQRVGDLVLNRIAGREYPVVDPKRVVDRGDRLDARVADQAAGAVDDERVVAGVDRSAQVDGTFSKRPYPPGGPWTIP